MKKKGNKLKKYTNLKWTYEKVQTRDNGKTEKEDKGALLFRELLR